MSFYHCDECGRAVRRSDTPHWLQCTGLCADCEDRPARHAGMRRDVRLSIAREVEARWPDCAEAIRQG